MPNPTPSTRLRPCRERNSSAIIGGAAALAIALAACAGGSDADSGSGTEGSDAPRTTATSPVESAPPASTVAVATTGPLDTTPLETTPHETTPPATAVPPSGPLTLDELRTILPTAAEVGPGFVLDENPTEVADDARVFDEESLMVCPGLANLLLEPDDPSAESAEVKFSDQASTRVVEVRISPAEEVADVAAAQAELDELIAGIDACPLIIGEVAGIGLYTAFPAIEQLEGPGDSAYRFTLDGTLANEMLTLPLDFRITFWERDGVTVIVAATSGLDDVFDAVPNDDAALDALAAAVDARLVDLQR
jgi:hypothetical protein